VAVFTWRKPVMRNTYIRVRLIHEGIEQFHGLPDTHAGTATALEVDASLDIEGDSLVFCR
jgi:hypothetical protein